jgi:hypothetical protein
MGLDLSLFGFVFGRYFDRQRFCQIICQRVKQKFYSFLVRTSFDLHTAVTEITEPGELTEKHSFGITSPCDEAPVDAQLN